MQTFRAASRAPRARLFFPSSYPIVGKRFAQQSYGNEQSGHEQASKDTPNPKAHMEHPGPEAPADQGKGKPKEPSSSGQSSQASSGQSSQKSSSQSTSHGGSPAIHNPKSAKEQDDPGVKKHNDEMRNRSDRTHNQLSESENKVDKKFWSGKLLWYID